ncbi:MAG: LOG family protein [Phycisphaerae bacterium]|nr:LOG family protein [Phycisphaerae bacterium]
MSGIPNGHPVICVFGSYSPKPGSLLYQLAYDIGHALATAGYTVANGGYDGTMEASAKGAKDAGGKTIGVTCSAFDTARGRTLAANPWIDREIHHTDVMLRIKDMMIMSDGYVILEGGTGTMTELSLVWEFVCKQLIPPRPIFVVGDFWRPMIKRIIAQRPGHGQHVYLVDTPQQIVDIATRTVPPDTGRLGAGSSVASRAPIPLRSVEQASNLSLDRQNAGPTPDA